MTAAFLVAAWQGYGWAISLLAISFALGILVTIAMLTLAISAGSRVGIVVCLLYGLAAAAILRALFCSRSLNAFFKHQEQHRSSAASAEETASDKRNLVTLTPAAAELVRRNITDRQYPPETALRVVRRDDRQPGIDVQYDVVSDDGRDWVGESSGIVVLVSQAISDQVDGLTIDVENGAYAFRLSKRTA